MATQLPPENVTRSERSYCVERSLPMDGNYSLRIHREIVSKDDAGNIIMVEQLPFRYSEAVAVMAKREATRAYLKACQESKSIVDLMAAEAELYDSLVGEVLAEKTAAKESAKNANR